MPSATSTTGEFWFDRYSEGERTLDDLDDDIRDIIE
jgi:hypothetical protein